MPDQRFSVLTDALSVVRGFPALVRGLPVIALAFPAIAAANSPVTHHDSVAFDYDAFILSTEQAQSEHMQQLVARNQQFKTAVKLACDSAADSKIALNRWSDLNDLQHLWQESARQWQRIQVFPLGPNTDTTVRLNMTFWPDKKNLVERKMRSMVKQGTSVDIRKGGIAVQGMAASEYLLFDPGHLESASVAQTCPSLMAVSQQSLKNSQGLLTRWNESEFLSHWHDAGLGNETFASTTQAAGYLLAGLAQSAEIVAKDKVYKPFRLNKAQALSNRYLAENWRSGLSLDNMQQNLADIEQLYRGLDGRNGPHQLLLRKGFKQEADAIVQQLQQVRQNLNKLNEMGDQAFVSAEARETGRQIYQGLKRLEKAMKKPLSHFNLTQKFNSRDGD